MKLTKLLGIALVSALALTGCKDEKAAEAQKPLKVGVMTGPEAQMTEVAVKIAKEKYGLDVELVQFTEYTQPNAALHAKDLDANAFQTVPYLEQESKDRGYKMAVIGNTLLWPIAAYSNVKNHQNKENKRNRNLAKFYGRKWAGIIENRGFAVHCPFFLF